MRGTQSPKPHVWRASDGMRLLDDDTRREFSDYLQRCAAIAMLVQMDENAPPATQHMALVTESGQTEMWRKRRELGARIRTMLSSQASDELRQSLRTVLSLNMGVPYDQLESFAGHTLRVVSMAAPVPTSLLAPLGGGALAVKARHDNRFTFVTTDWCDETAACRWSPTCCLPPHPTTSLPRKLGGVMVGIVNGDTGLFFDDRANLIGGGIYGGKMTRHGPTTGACGAIIREGVAFAVSVTATALSLHVDGAPRASFDASLDAGLWRWRFAVGLLNEHDAVQLL